MRLNEAALQFIDERIRAGYFVSGEPFALTPEERLELEREPETWSRINLGIDEAQPEDDSSRYVYPVAKRIDGEIYVYRTALNDIQISAANAGESDVVEATETLRATIEAVASGDIAATETDGDGGSPGKPPEGTPPPNMAPGGTMSGDVLSTRVYYRTAKVDLARAQEDDRTIEVAFSSEEPVQRFFGWEVLDHDASSIDLRRLRDGGPVLVEHNPTEHVGVVEEVWIGPDRRGRARVRFGRSARAEEVFRDVLDGIRSKTSVGYAIEEMAPDGKRDGEQVFRAVRWSPLEISIVSVPADMTVGINRAEAREDDRTIETKVLPSREEPDDEDQEGTETMKKGIAAPVRHYSPDDTGAATNSVDANEVRAIEKRRQGRIRALARQLGPATGVDLTKEAEQAIDSDLSFEEFNDRCLEKIGTRQKPTEIADPTDATRDLGLTHREATAFSIRKAALALLNPRDSRAQEAAAFEFDVSRAAADAVGKDPQGLFIPTQVQRAAIQAGSGGSGGGENTVATEVLASSFIDVLRARSAIMPFATMLRDLSSDVKIPRAATGATGGWVSTEGGDAAESAATFEQVGLSPNTVAAWVEVTHRLLVQSSIDVEAFLRRDLALAMALAIDLAAVNGAGASGVPQGILQKSGIGSASGTSRWDKVVSLETAVAAENADMGSLMYLTNPTVRGHLKTTEKASNTAQFIWSDGNEVNGYPARVSTQIPNDLGAGSNESAMIFGNFADVMIGMFGPLDLLVDPYSNSKSGVVRIRALQEADVNVRNEESFAADLDATDVT